MNSTVSFFSQFSIVKINYFPLSAHALGNAAFIPCVGGSSFLVQLTLSSLPTRKMNQNSPLGEQSKKGEIYSKEMQFSGSSNTVFFSPSFFILL